MLRRRYDIVVFRVETGSLAQPVSYGSPVRRKITTSPFGSRMRGTATRDAYRQS